MSHADSPTKHGKRADNIAVMTVPMPKTLHREIAALADADQRSLAAYVRIHLASLARRSRAARRKAVVA